MLAVTMSDLAKHVKLKYIYSILCMDFPHPSLSLSEFFHGLQWKFYCIFYRSPSSYQNIFETNLLFIFN